MEVRGGKLTVILENCLMDEKFCAASADDLSSGRYLQLSVRDTGTGMEQGGDRPDF